jgi:hypothetical protein
MVTINVNVVSATTRYPSRAGGQYGAAKTSVTDLAPEASQAKPAAIATQGRPNNAQNQPLNDAEMAVVSELKSIDSEVRLHEQAHLAQAGGLAMSGANFTYKTGPDNRRYAVGGEVQINAGPGRTPEETLRKAQIIRAAALAPAQPSPQDRAVAASAGQMEQEARAEIAQRAATAKKLAQSYGSTDSPVSRFIAQA